MEERDIHLPDGTLWARCEVARTFFQRLRGLLGRDGLGPGRAMLIKRCNAVHTVGMRFSLDLVFVAKDGTVLRVFRAVPPGRLMVWGGFRAAEVFESQAGVLDLRCFLGGKEVRLLL